MDQELQPFRMTLDLGDEAWPQRPKRGQRLRVIRGDETYEGEITAVRHVEKDKPWMGYRIYLRAVSGPRSA